MVAIVLLRRDYASRIAFAFAVSANREMESCLRFSHVADVSRPALKDNTIDVFLVSLIRPSPQASKHVSLREARALWNNVDYIKIRKCDLPMTQPIELNFSNSIY